jgi:hypothetical protein
MRYHVRGISRTNGRETTLVVEAKHHEAAKAIATRQLIVSEVVPEGGLTEPEAFDPRSLDAPQIEDPAEALARAVNSRPATPTPSRPRRRDQRNLIFISLAILLAILVVVLIMRRA